MGVEDFFGRPLDSSKRPITHDGAASLAPVFCAVRLISETIASMPVGVVRANADGTREPVEHPAATLLDAPNPINTRFEFFECALSQLELRGNSYIETVRRDGNVVGLWPMRPGTVTAERVGADIQFKVQTRDGVVPAGRDQIMHWRFGTLSPDGVTGADPVKLLHDDLGAARAARDHAKRYFSNSANPSGYIKHPAHLSNEAVERLRRCFAAKYQGEDNTGGVLLLDEGTEWQSISNNGEDSQLLETRQFSIQDVARIWRVPPHFLGDLSRSNFANAESESLSLVKYSLRPRVIRLEQALDRALLTDAERRDGLSIKFNMDSLLRGETATRYAAHQIGIMSGFLTRNEARVKEDLPPLPGLDETITMPGAQQTPAQ